MTGKVIIAGLGPAGPELITSGTHEAIESAGVIRLRTKRHPAASVFDFASYDDFYESADSYDDVYDAIVADLVALAATADVLYLVPGSPRVGEVSVERLIMNAAVECSVLPAMSFLDLVWVRLGLDPVAAGLRLVDGHRFVTDVAGHTGPFLVAQCSDRAVLSDVKLALDEGPATATLLHHLGLPDERIECVPWADIDRVLEADHLTSLFVPRVPAPLAAEIVRFDELVRRLRIEVSRDGERSNSSTTGQLIGEASEVVKAIDRLDVEADDADAAFGFLQEKLEDLLYQIVSDAALATEAGYCTLADVARGAHDKVLRR